MKPIFIRNHEKENIKKQKEFFELFMRQGGELEDEFVKTDLKEKKRMLHEATMGIVHVDGAGSTTDAG